MWQRRVRTKPFIYTESTTVSLETVWAVMPIIWVNRNLNQRINERGKNV